MCNNTPDIDIDIKTNIYCYNDYIGMFICPDNIKERAEKNIKNHINKLKMINDKNLYGGIKAW